MSAVRRLYRTDFTEPPDAPFVACAFETTSRYGELDLFVGRASRAEYERRYERDPRNTKPIARLGRAAGFHACEDVSVYSRRRVLDVGVQYADCGIRGELVTLARAALQRSSSA